MRTKTAGRGVYAVRPHRVQGIIMLLVGVKDLLDARYTPGAWDEPARGLVLLPLGVESPGMSTRR